MAFTWAEKRGCVPNERQTRDRKAHVCLGDIGEARPAAKEPVL